VVPGNDPTLRTVQAVIEPTLLPAGRYVARARVMREGKVAGVLVRPFILDPQGTASTAPPPFIQGAVAEFDPGQAMTSEILRSLLDSVEKEFPGLDGPLAEARAGRFGTAAIEALLQGEQAAAAFFKGLDWYSLGQFGQAATQFEVASGPRREFFAAAFYLGAVFAASGRDQDAAGVWQLALGDEPRPMMAYTLLADARLRDGQPGAVIDVLRPVYERLPEDERDGLRPVNLMVLRPSRDLGELAQEFESSLPRGFRFLTRGLGTRETKSPDFLSLILFQPEYLRALMQIGEEDADRQGEAIASFMAS